MSYTSALAKAMQQTREVMMENLMRKVYSTHLATAVDGYIMQELRKKLQPPEEKRKVIKGLLMDMFQDNLPLDNIWRVEIRDNHEIHLTDFTMPSSSDTLQKTIPITEAPDFIRNGLAVLQIVQDDTHVDGVGKRISETIFYIVERDSGGDSGKESQRCD
jgi:hypothetical protein